MFSCLVLKLMVYAYMFTFYVLFPVSGAILLQRYSASYRPGIVTTLCVAYCISMGVKTFLERLPCHNFQNRQKGLKKKKYNKITWSKGLQWLFFYTAQPRNKPLSFIQMVHKLALNSPPPPCFVPTHRSCHLTLASTPAVMVSDRKAPGKLTSHWEVILKVIAAETLWRGSAVQRGWYFGISREDGSGIMPSVLSCNLTSMGKKKKTSSSFPDLHICATHLHTSPSHFIITAWF